MKEFFAEGIIIIKFKTIQKSMESLKLMESLSPQNKKAMSALLWFVTILLLLVFLYNFGYAIGQFAANWNK